MSQTMSVMFCAVCLVIFSPEVVPVYADRDASLTDNKSNGRHWNSLNHNEKIEYMTGYHEGIVASASVQCDLSGANKESEANLENTLSNLKRRLLPLGATYESVVTYLDDFYAKAENLDKPIIEACSNFTGSRAE